MDLQSKGINLYSKQRCMNGQLTDILNNTWYLSF